MINKIFYKNVEFLMSELHHKDLIEHLKSESNSWLQVSLQPIVETDENGLIIMFRPTKQMSLGLVYFFQQLMLEQRCYLMDTFLKKQGVIK